MGKPSTLHNVAIMLPNGSKGAFAKNPRLRKITRRHVFIQGMLPSNGFFGEMLLIFVQRGLTVAV